MALVRKLPEELCLGSGKDAALAAAVGKNYVLVAASRFRRLIAIALFDRRGASHGSVGVLAEGDDASWVVRRVCALPGDRFLLTTTSGPGRFVTCPGLAISLADVGGRASVADPLFGGDDLGPRDVFWVKGIPRVGHGSHFANVSDFQSLSTLPASLTGRARPWVPDLGERAAGHGVFITQFHATRGVTLGERLVLACCNRQRSGSSSHSFVALDARGDLVCLRRDAAKRAIDPHLELAADAKAGVVYVASAKGMEALDANLKTVGKTGPTGLLASHRLLGSDGKGAFLWYSARSRSLFLTERGALDARHLAGSLRALANPG